MAQISIGFSTDPKSWVSKIIRWFTKSKYSHTFIVVRGDPVLGDLVVESDSGGVQIKTFNGFNFTKNPLLKEVAISDDVTVPLRHTLDLLGSSYDYTGLVGMSWVELMWHVFKKKVHNPLHSKNALFCVAFVIVFMQQMDWKNSGALVPQDNDAQMLADFIDSNLE
jgi:hypothetical protein